MPNMSAGAIIQALGLAPHPEGGHYRESWADPGGSAIYFLLQEGERSSWHRVLGRAEIWHFYAGAPLELSIDQDDDGRVATIRLGDDLLAGERPQAVVGADVWQSARSTGAWSLAGCTVAPPFTFEAFEMRG
jgi:predicted cupin superfamily sugar epimerase